MPDLVRIVVAEDHPFFRDGLRLALGRDDRLQIVGEASNGREAVDKVRAYMPDVVLMDLLMPEMDGIAATRAIKEFAPDVKVIVLTSFQDDEHIMPAIEAGATGYLLKDVSAPDLVKAIEGAYAGHAQLHPEVARKLMEQLAKTLPVPLPERGNGRPAHRGRRPQCFGWQLRRGLAGAGCLAEQRDQGGRYQRYRYESSHGYA